MEEFISDENSRRFGDDYIKLIIKEIQAAGKDSSGKLVRSIDYRLANDVDRVEFLFEGEDYFKYVDEGRKPGSFPPIQAIGKWARINGISQDAVFPIARSIFKFGIKPTNISNKVENQLLNGRLFNDLEDYFQEGIEEKVYEDLKKTFKDKN